LLRKKIRAKRDRAGVQKKDTENEIIKTHVSQGKTAGDVKEYLNW
jgi:hypothetical protein